MHKTEKRAKESRMNLMYSYLCDRTLVESMSGYSFACGVKSLDLANPRQKNSNPSGEVNLSKKHYARLIGSEINALCRDGSVLLA